MYRLVNVLILRANTCQRSTGWIGKEAWTKLEAWARQRRSRLFEDRRFYRDALWCSDAFNFQANHAYTLSVSCSGLVHNIGVRRSADGRLALGFARRGQRSFTSVTSLLRHHRRRRLLLVADGSVVGATTLNDTPQYYQTPSSMPVRVTDDWF